jgi:hypothetical protein
MSAPVTAADGLTYYSKDQISGTTNGATLRYRYAGAGVSGSAINWYRSSVTGTLTATGTDLGADSALNGYVALAIPTGVTTGTVSITYKLTAGTGKVAILGSNAATPGSGTTNIILASYQFVASDTNVALSTTSISLAGYKQIKVIYSREGATTGGIDLSQIRVAP